MPELKISWYAIRAGMVRREWHDDGIGYTDSDLISFIDAANLLEKYENNHDALIEALEGLTEALKRTDTSSKVYLWKPIENAKKALEDAKLTKEQ